MISTEALLHTIHSLEERLLSKRLDDGSWAGEVELNPGPSAQAVLLHKAVDLEFPDLLKAKAENYFVRSQNQDGGWSSHYKAPSDISVSAEVYVASRLLGVPRDSEFLTRARRFIVDAGGLSAANPWTQLYLAFLGVIPWNDLFKVPIEAIFVPEGSPLSFSRMAYWVKVISMPMALLGSLGPRAPIEIADELKADLTWRGQKESPPWLLALSNFWTKWGKIPGLRSKAQSRALKKIAEFTEDHGDFGGNTCTAMVVLLSLYRMNKKNSPEFERGLGCLMSYAIERKIENKIEWHLQCCQSVVWDTGFALWAISSGVNLETIRKSVEWLKSRQILERRGDWARRIDALPGGWCFGNRHEHFPVTDCTGLAVLAIAKHDPQFLKSVEARRALDWLLAMQHETGGWSAYEKYQGSLIVERLGRFKDIPNGLLDVPKADVTSKVVEALCLFRDLDPRVEDALRRARQFLVSSRDSRGIWKGNYGVNYLYGTSFAAKALFEIDRGPGDDWAPRARDFFLTTQRPDGGWGEAEQSYANSDLAGSAAESSIVQTSWALLGLMKSGKDNAAVRSAVVRGVRYLLNCQENNQMTEPRFLGTVFPGMVYFRYELYDVYFPAMALAAARDWIDKGPTEPRL